MNATERATQLLQTMLIWTAIVARLLLASLLIIALTFGAFTAILFLYRITEAIFTRILMHAW